MQESYKIYPFRFKRLKDGKVLLINDVGDYYVVSSNDLINIINKNLDSNSQLAMDLEAKDFVTLKYTKTSLNRLAHRYRTKKKYLFDSTALHMLVMTHRCNQACVYCHASSCGNETKNEDMSIEVATKSIDIAFESPSEYIKIEFQGGEPLLNKDVILKTIEYAQEKNQQEQKKLEFVICTNLLNIDDQLIKFLQNNTDIQISTSLDGPEKYHNFCRQFPNGTGTYTKFIDKLHHIRKYIGSERISALTTISKFNLHNMTDIVDEYISNKFSSIFLRPLNPFGYAEKQWKILSYPIEEFIKEYIKALKYIIKLNKKGLFLREEFACIFLYKILTPYSSGFVDIQSPSGLGISGTIYDVNGNVYVSDEARMLARSNKDERFCLGNVLSDNRQKLYSNPILRKILLQSTIETLPKCAWCAFQPYCGSDPVKNFVRYRNYISPKYEDDNCKLYTAIITELFNILLSDNEEEKDILFSWITNTNEEKQGENHENI